MPSSTVGAPVVLFSFCLVAAAAFAQSSPQGSGAAVGADADAARPASIPPAARAAIVGVGASCTPASAATRMHYQLGQMAMGRGDETLAREAYLEALEADPAYCDAMDQLGVVARHAGKLDEAVSWYRKSLAVNPRGVMPLRNLGLVYSMQGKYAEAVEEYDRAIELDPGDPEGWYGKGEALAESDKPRDALAAFEQARARYEKEGSPLRAHAQLGLARMHFKLGECPPAIEVLEPALPQLSTVGQAYYILGICDAVRGDSDKARAYLLKARELGVKLPAQIGVALDGDAKITVELR